MAQSGDWFIVLVVTTPNEDEPGEQSQPKYIDTEGVNSYTGQTHVLPPDDGSQHAGQEVFIIRIFGTQSAIDHIASQPDVEILPGQSGVSVARYFNDKFGRDLTANEWTSKFGGDRQ